MINGSSLYYPPAVGDMPGKIDNLVPLTLRGLLGSGNRTRSVRPDRCDVAHLCSSSSVERTKRGCEKDDVRVRGQPLPDVGGRLTFNRRRTELSPADLV